MLSTLIPTRNRPQRELLKISNNDEVLVESNEDALATKDMWA